MEEYRVHPHDSPATNIVSPHDGNHMNVPWTARHELDDPKPVYSPIVQTADNKQWIDLDFVSPKLLREIKRQYTPSLKSEPSSAIEKSASKIKAWARQSKRGVDIRLRRRVTGQPDEVVDVKLKADGSSLYGYNHTSPIVAELPAELNEITELSDTSPLLELDSAPIQLLRELSEHNEMERRELEEPPPSYEPRRHPETVPALSAASDATASSSDEGPSHRPASPALSIVSTPRRGLSLASSNEQESQLDSSSHDKIVSPVEPFSANESDRDAWSRLNEELQAYKMPLRYTPTSDGAHRTAAHKTTNDDENIGLISPLDSTQAFRPQRRSESQPIAVETSASAVVEEPTHPLTATARRRKSIDYRKRSTLRRRSTYAPASSRDGLAPLTPALESKSRAGSSFGIACQSFAPVSDGDPESIWAHALELQAKILGVEHPLVYQAKSDCAKSRANDHEEADPSALLISKSVAFDTLGATHPLALSFSQAVQDFARIVPGNSRRRSDVLRRSLPRIETSPANLHYPVISIHEAAEPSHSVTPNTDGSETLSPGNSNIKKGQSSPCTCSSKAVSPTSPTAEDVQPVHSHVEQQIALPQPFPVQYAPRKRQEIATFGRLAIAGLMNTFTDGLVWLRQNVGPEPEVEQSKVRVRWTCSCGEQLYDDFIERRSGAARELEVYLNTPRGHAGGGSGTTPSSASSSQNSRSNNSSPMAPPSSSTSWSSYGLSANTGSDKQKDPNLSSRATGAMPPLSPLYEPPWLLTCASERRFDTKLAHLDVAPYKVHSDKDLALALRGHYFNVSKRWWQPLRLRGLTTIEFVQFEVHQNRFADIRKCPDMPDAGGQYDFEPGDLLPPVGSNYLLHLFKHPEDYDGERIAYMRVPKKSGRLHMGIGWGVNLVEGFLADRVWMLSCIFFALGSLVFAVLWAWKEHSMQSAFGVASWMVTVAVLAMGWAQAYFE